MLKRATQIPLVFGFLLGIANSLSCFNCNTTISCHNPGLQVCENATAIINSNWLSSIYMEVSYINASNSFECLDLPYLEHIDNASNILQFSGCVFRDIDICSLNPQSDQEVIDCKTCNWDYCNRNSSNVLIRSNSNIMIAALVLIMFKILNCTI